MQSSPFTPSLLDVVSDFKTLQIEDYQRTYSWEKEQIEEFVEDLKECVRSGENHFFGTLILQENDSKKDVATVVDGQQRLTTAFILVATLRDAIKELPDHIIAPAKENLRPIDVRDKAWNFLCSTTNLNEHRFVSSRFLRDLMENSVLAEPERQIALPARDRTVTLAFRKGVRQIRELIRKDLTNYPDATQKLQRINAILDALLERFLVLRVSTKSLSESLDIFLTLNNRGLPLGPSDLVRGEIMSVRGQGLPDSEQLKLQKTILEEWQTIAENVSEPEAFIRHYLVATSEEKVQKKKVVTSVLKRINDENLLVKQKNAESFWQDLMSAAITYGQIMNPTMGGDCQYHLELLDGLLKSHRILLLTVFRNELEEADRNEICRLVFVLSYRWVMAGKNAQKLEDTFQDLSKEVRQNEPVQSIKVKLEAEINDIELDVKKYFTNDADSAFASRALLHAVNRATTRGANSIQLDNKKLHLEHIAPQSETDDWVSSVFNGDSKQFSDYESIIGSIGNLTLLDNGLNLQAQRKPFEEKKKEYRKSTMDVARDLMEFTTWNKETINLRTEWLVEMFEIIWSAKQSKSQPQAFSNWFKSR